MIKARFDDREFLKTMNQVVKYAEGFLEGVNVGKKELFETIGENTIEILNSFIDSNARANPQMLHHIYEWYQTGSPNARLFDLEYSTSGGGLTVRSSFRQSTVIKSGSSVPFYDKARIMEQGIPVRIKPVRSEVLRFEDGGEEVFTKKPVDIANPGGDMVNGGFQRVVDSFFNSYFSQAFLQSSGIADILKNPIEFKKNLPRAKTGGKALGYDVGYRWIAAKGAR